MKLFKKKSKRESDKVESRFQQGLNLVKDLDKREFNRFVEGLTLGWRGYDIIRRVQTIDEKENGNPDIDESEKILTREVEKKEAK